MKLSFLSLALAPFAVVRGDDISKYKLLSPAGGGGCADSGDWTYSNIGRYFDYKDYRQLGGYSGMVDKCAGWCLQNGSPQYNMIGFKTYTKKYAEDSSDPYIQCECLFEGDL
eukprot:scaffold12956_cov71-Cyclotella_meneghiniana.AAC.1